MVQTGCLRPKPWPCDPGIWFGQLGRSATGNKLHPGRSIAKSGPRQLHRSACGAALRKKAKWLVPAIGPIHEIRKPRCKCVERGKKKRHPQYIRNPKKEEPRGEVHDRSGLWYRIRRGGKNSKTPALMCVDMYMAVGR